MLIDSKLISIWMRYIRDNPSNAQRFSECFWESQLVSKEAAIELLKNELSCDKDNVYIFGGWYGVFAELLHYNYPHKYYNIDLDPSCQQVFDEINTTDDIMHFTANMSEFEYLDTPYMVINTSSEHVTQEVYNAWWDNIPKGTKYLVQGNNFFETDEHVRCTETLEEFVKINYLMNAAFKDTIECGMRPDGSPFYRFMAIGVK